MSPPDAVHGTPLIVGEVLFDHFPDDSMVLGGAPFNVAWHLQGFGASPLFVSRVGTDPEGDRVRSTMARWGMGTQALQSDVFRPTGRVEVRLGSDGPGFDIVADQAYDHIDWAAATEAANAASPALIYHGTLVTRVPQTGKGLSALKQDTGLPCFLDVNLRDPWWRADAVLRAVSGARWVKLNDTELARLTRSAPTSREEQQGLAVELRERHGLDALIVTLGAGGAFCVTARGIESAVPARIARLVDTVGAGDALSAVLIFGFVQGWEPGQSLVRATAFAADICQIRGATSDDRSLYERHLQRWSAAP